MLIAKCVVLSAHCVCAWWSSCVLRVCECVLSVLRVCECVSACARGCECVMCIMYSVRDGDIHRLSSAHRERKRQEREKERKREREYTRERKRGGMRHRKTIERESHRWQEKSEKR